MRRLAAALLLLSFLLFPAAAAPSFTVVVTPETVSTNQYANFTLNLSNIGGPETVYNFSIDASALGPGPIPTNNSFCPSGYNVNLIGSTTMSCNTTGSGIASGAYAISIFGFVQISSSSSAGAAVNVTGFNSTGSRGYAWDSVVIQRAAALSTSATSPLPSRLVAGQTGTSATFTVVNVGEATANLVVPNATVDSPYSGASLTIPGAQTIYGGGSRSFTINADVPTTPTSGTFRLNFFANGQDVNSLVNVTDTSYSSATVYAFPTLQVYSLSSNVTYVSTDSGHRAARLSIVAGVPGSPAVVSEANITGIELTIGAGNGTNFSSRFTAPVRIDGITTIYAGTNATLIFDLAAINPPEGQFYANISVSYTDGIAAITTAQAAATNRSAFIVDLTAPVISVQSVSPAQFVRLGETATVNATVYDALSGTGASSCQVAVGGVSAGTVPYSAGYCQGSFPVPVDASIYGSKNIVVSMPDAVSNPGQGSYGISVYTLIVNTTDALSGADIRDTPDLSNATAVAANSSGGNTFSCTPLYGTKSNLCGVPLGTVVNVTAYSPGYVMNNNTTDSSRVCVGTGTLSVCAASLPSGGAASVSIGLTPNTKVNATNQFRQPLVNANVTVTDSGLPPWLKGFLEGGPDDRNSTANGVLVAPLDTGKRTSPFTVGISSQFLNPGYLDVSASPYTPSIYSQGAISLSANFTLLVSLFNELDAQINTTSGSVTFLHSGGSVACVQNPSNYSQYGCPAPISAGSGNVTIYKPGYVSANLTGISLPAASSSPQTRATANLSFNLAVRVWNEFTSAALSQSEIERVALPSGNCTFASGGKWLCAAVQGDEALLEVLPLATAGYMRSGTISPLFVDYVQTSSNISLSYSFLMQALDELSLQINASTVTVLQGAGISCVQNGTTSYWGCPVPVGTASSNVSANVSQSAGRMNYRSVSPYLFPPNISASRTTGSSSNKYTVRVNAYSELGLALPTSNLSASWNGTSCLQSSGSLFCAVPAGNLSTIALAAAGYLNYSNSSVTAPAVSGSQLEFNSTNEYPLFVRTNDQFGTPKNMSGGSVSFASSTCAHSEAYPYDWGCAAPAGQQSTVAVSRSGYVNYESANYSAPSAAGPQQQVNTSNQYTLKVVAYDQFGTNLTAASMSAGGQSCFQFPGQPDNAYFCPAEPPSSVLTVSKSGFVTSNVNVTGLSAANQTTYVLSPGSGAPQYSAVISVWRYPSSGDSVEMASGVRFFNLTTRSEILPANSSENRYYFALPAGINGILVNKSGYVDKAISFNTTSTSQSAADPVMDFSLRFDIRSEDNLSISGAAITMNASASFIESNGPQIYYYAAVPDGTYLGSVSRTGYVNGASGAFSVNTTYPANQTTVSRTLLYTLKVISSDWAASPLNATNISVTGFTPVILSSLSNTGYFAASPGTVAVVVSKSGYNTVQQPSVPISASSQAVISTSHAQNIAARATDWSGRNISGATLVLFAGASQVAQCVTGAAGSCTFLAYNGASNSTDQSFNSTEVSDGSQVIFRAGYPEFASGYSAAQTYYSQNSSAPLDAGIVRIGGLIRVILLQAWSNTTPVEGATAELLGAVTLAANLSDSSGHAFFLPNYSAPSSGADYFVGGNETSDGSVLSVRVSKSGYATQTAGLTFNSSAPANLTFLLGDNSEPRIETNISSSEGLAYVSFENFNISVRIDDIYGADASGPNFSTARYWIAWLNGTLARAAALLSGCSGEWCNATGVNGWDLPVGNLKIVVNVTDNSGNSNQTEFPFFSAPGYNETAVLIAKPEASSSGDDYFLVKHALVVKGEKAKLKISDLSPVGCAGCASFPTNGWASMIYRDVAQCIGSNLSAEVRQTFGAGQTPASFCDENATTPHAREQTVYLRLRVPLGLANARYNGSYEWTAIYEGMPRANVTIYSVASSNSTPETGTNFTINVSVHADGSSGPADDVVVGLSSANGSLVYPANTTILQIYSGETRVAQFTVTASASSLGPETLTARILSAYDGSTGLPATITQPAAGANYTNVTIVDLTAPLVFFGTNPVDTFNSSSASVTFDLRASDNFGLAGLAVYGNWSGGWSLKSANSSPYNNTWWNSTLSLPDGYFAWAAFANDSASNSNSSANRTILVDTVAPASFSFAAPTPAAYANLSRTYLEVNATFTELNPEACVVEINSANYSGTLYDQSAPSDYCEYNATALPAGTYTYRVYANDSAGNWGASSQRTAFLDTVEPLVFLGTNPVDTFNSSSASLTFDLRASDNMALAGLAVYGNWSGSWGARSVNASPYNNTWWNSTLSLPDGYFAWAAFANDSASNSNFSANRTLLVDTTAPAYSGTGQNDSVVNLTLGEVPLLYSLWSDSGIGLSSAVLETNETGSPANYTVLPLSGWSNFTWTNSTPLADGTLIAWRIWANDTLGNWNVTAPATEFLVVI